MITSQSKQFAKLTASIRSEGPLVLSHLFLFVAVPVGFFFKSVSNVILCLSVICFILNFILDKKWPQILNPTVYLFWAYYALQLLGLILTQNYEQGVSELETSFFFVIVPTILLTSEVKPRAVVFGLITTSLVSLIAAIAMVLNIAAGILQSKSGSVTILSPELQYKKIAAIIGMHPSYASLLFMVSAFILIYYFLPIVKKPALRIALAFAVVLLIFLLTLLMSRGPWVGFLISIFVCSIVFLRKQMRFIVPLTTAMIFTVALVAFNPLYDRFIGSFSRIGNPTEQNERSTAFHLKSWECAVKSPAGIVDFMFGAGVGDEVDRLVECYQIHNYSEMVQQRFNAHNDFLSQFVKNGVLGVAVLLSLYLICFFKAIQHHNVGHCFVLCLFFTASFFESYLNVRLGVLYFCFLIPMFSLAVSPHYIKAALVSGERDPVNTRSIV